MKFKTDILITLISNVILALSQWTIIASLNHSGNIDVVGQYSYSLALAGVLLTFGQMGLRQFLLSKSASSEHLDQVFVARLITSTFSWLMLIVYSLFLVADQYFWLVVLLGLAKIAENLSDIAHGFYQKNFQVRHVARSRIGRSVLTPCIFLGVFFTTKNLVIACVALFLTWILVFLAFDKKAFRSAQLSIGNVSQVPKILSLAYPMGIASVLVILSVSFPLFNLAKMSNDTQVGQYASIFYFVTAGGLVLQSALQVISPIIVARIKNQDHSAVKRIAGHCYLLGLGFGCCGIGLAAYLGEWVVTLVYGNSFTGLGKLVIVASFINFVISFQSVGGILLTAHGVFKFQMLVMFFAVLISMTSSSYLITSFGVEGALYAGVVTAFFIGVCFGTRVVIELRKNAKYTSVTCS